MPYIDGFLIPVRTADRDAFREFEAHWWPTFRDKGALSLVLGWGDDVPAGKVTDFRRAVDLRDDETVVFAWMTWPDKPTRDAAYRDMEEGSAEDMAAMPFDAKRMIYGGFTPILMEGAK
ncbi:MAG: DUF1428 domain-containing protein [Rhodobacteraceae bacterium]|nr:DUF1428 domain-containing protein [Paracoccaceae bacterium]